MSNPSTPDDQALPRVLGPWVATAIVAGTVIGSGVFLTPKKIAQVVEYPGLVAVVWVFGALFALVGALIYAEVAVLLPRAGGNYVFLREGYGRLFGWMWGWVDFWMIRAGSIAALATAFATSLHDIYTNADLRRSLGLAEAVHVPLWGQRAVTVTLLLLLGAVNVRGVRLGGWLQLALTSVKVLAMVVIILLPFVLMAQPGLSPVGFQPSVERLSPLWPARWDLTVLSGFVTAMLYVLWPYHGWMNIASVAGEVKEPQRNLPLALIAGVLVCVVLYLGCNLAYYLCLTTEEMQNVGDTPAATAAALKMIGPLGVVLMSAVVMCSVFGSLNGNILVGPRLLYAMGEDGLVPRWLHAVHPAWKTPASAIAVLVAWSVVLVTGVGVLVDLKAFEPGRGSFDKLTDLAMFGAVIFETMAVLAIFTLRWKMPDADRPYRAPGYPWLPVLYAVLPVVILVNMLSKWESAMEALAGLGWIAVGVGVYYALDLDRTGPQSSVGA